MEYIGKATISVNRDVLLSIPDESIVPYTLESMVSAICVSGTYLGNNQFKMTICVTTILKVLAEAEILIPSYGYCPIPPAEEFAESDGQRQQHGAFQLQLWTRMLRLVQRQLQLR